MTYLLIGCTHKDTRFFFKFKSFFFLFFPISLCYCLYFVNFSRGGSIKEHFYLYLYYWYSPSKIVPSQKTLPMSIVWEFCWGFYWFYRPRFGDFFNQKDLIKYWMIHRTHPGHFSLQLPLEETISSNRMSRVVCSSWLQ